MAGTIPKTGEARNGRTVPITLGTIGTLNCTDTVGLAPAMNEPSVEMQNFQGGDAVNVTVDGGYQSSTYTCEYTKTMYEAIDQARADATELEITIGTDDDAFTGTGLVSVSEGPTLNVNGTSVPTMTVTVTWTMTKAPSGVGA